MYQFFHAGSGTNRKIQYDFYNRDKTWSTVWSISWNYNDAINKLNNRLCYGASAGIIHCNLNENNFQFAIFSNSSNEIYMYQFNNCENASPKIVYKFCKDRTTGVWADIWTIS